ncbi:hypothetical protein BGZ99_008748 [Dissophora globulifera]|uniref:Uncharacterized protein n=1 Tax=Dissophora globulifera TaxID=979702 RepID=A0A9P6UP74_9FUNG|nr:hypothetical protein BGZ99_008748 [Dissophora globulifera]
MGAEIVSTHTVKNDATTTILTRTTTIVSEYEEFVAPKDGGSGIVENVRRSFRDYWYPSTQDGQPDDDDSDDTNEIQQDPLLLRNNSVMRRAYDYWKTLTLDADEAAKRVVIEAKKARDDAAAEARWAILGYKKEAREALDNAEQKYREALAAAERVHEEAHEKAKSKWFQTLDTTEREVDNLKDQTSEITHRNWDRFKSAVNSLAFNPPKYGCSPSSQYWFSTGPRSSWDCREVWDHPSRHDHRHQSIKTLPKKHLPTEKVHDTLNSLWNQAAGKAKSAPSVSSFESSLKPVKDYYFSLLDRIHRNEQGAVEELDSLFDKAKDKLNEAKYYEEQTDSWLTSQWNAVVDNTGSIKNQYERAFKNTLKNVKNTRAEIYNSLINNLQRSLNVARNNINDAYLATKDQADKSRLHKAIKDATDSFSNTVKDAEAKIKSAPKHAYDNAVESFHRDTDHLKAKLEHAASVASKSASSASAHASKSGSSVLHHASKSASSLSAHASKSVSSAANQATHDAQKGYKAASDKARQGYEQASASVSSLWGSATPVSPMHKVQHQYHRLVGDVQDKWFDDRDHADASISSIYGAFLAVYFLFLAHRIWRNRRLARMIDTRETTVTVVTNGDDLGNGQHTTKLEKFKTRPSTEDALEQERNSFGSVLTQFTSVVPVTLILLVLLDLSGFSRVALHSLFIGLVTSQVLQGGLLNRPLRQMGIVDGVHASGRDIGTYLSWAILGLAAFANAIKILPY